MITIQSPEKIKVMRELQKKVTEANEEYLDFLDQLHDPFHE